MPELPEVENVRKTLNELIIGKKIDHVTIGVPKMMVHTDPDEFRLALVGQTFEAVRRRGKFLIFDLTDCSILAHLRMEGKFRLNDETDEVTKHTHVIFHFTDHTELRFLDVRKFGTMEWIEKYGEVKTKSIAKLGPEPFPGSFELEPFRSKIMKSSRAIKTLLLDQKYVAGIGNIYADEICYRAKVLPMRPADSLSEIEVSRIYEETMTIMEEAVALGGSTIRTYVNSQGKLGQFQEKLVVYGHDGDACPICGTVIEKIKLNGRGTHFCPHCQK
ncbi:formamidopyrimidine/5-formyluracil/ 5-hydroxymethyluracil DNA glycosylase [Listeria floridensis FSL S10-1187]|uniref:Formamidopyrimidine-DNA glycosylase n=1 Tax=Listeria floridensis FSL S10-1187 TaxID=1265817 RepID=A0ABP3B2D0_9LIST|nr:DNA-formamidopyrimidine glycosylase [Listeria floridensis]EUJ33264.1 formamidopyrimidine/5-formyluracil/ 5-hydroxymethyluracil DNA glycosylase [Listeria floridensis FSL S10-1187]